MSAAVPYASTLTPPSAVTRPLLQHHDLRRQLAQLGGVVADIDHRHALVAQPHQIGQDLVLAALVERAERFVEQQQSRLRQQRAAERDALALAAGELAGTAVEQMRRCRADR